MNIGETVILIERDEEYVATVLEVRELEHHNGKDGQPLLHLGFFAPAFQADARGELQRVRLVGTHRQDQLANFRLDVAHVSHEFPEHLKLASYPGGRWVEATKPEVILAEEVADETESSAGEESTSVEGEPRKKKKKKTAPDGGILETEETVQ